VMTKDEILSWIKANERFIETEEDLSGFFVDSSDLVDYVMSLK